MTSHDATSAETFHLLHQEGLLLLPNAWDAGTARLIESRGARAIATTSAGVAWSHGYKDGYQLPSHLLLGTVAAIARVIEVPLSVDIEDGYSKDPAAVGELVARVIDAGGVGINIEDGPDDPALLCAKIESAKSACDRRGVNLYVNARIDVYLKGLAPEERRVEETLARAERYRNAGADGIFVPGVARADEIRTLAAGVERPLNVLAWPGLPSVAELEKLGVRRLSAGSGINQAVYNRISSLTDGFLEEGAASLPKDGEFTHATINALFDR